MAMKLAVRTIDDLSLVAGLDFLKKKAHKEIIKRGRKNAISCRSLTMVINVVKATCAHFMYISKYCHEHSWDDDVSVSKESRSQM